MAVGYYDTRTHIINSFGAEVDKVDTMGLVLESTIVDL